MTQPDYVPYRGTIPSEADLAYLKVLSILHYVWGGLTILFSCFGIMYIVMGMMYVSGNSPLNRNFSPTTGPVIVSSPFGSPQPQPPSWFGYLFIGMGSCLMIFGWTIGILTIISGRKMAQHRSRVFSMVMAGVNCISFPLGTVLGVFTIIMLSKDSVKAMYVAEPR